MLLKKLEKEYLAPLKIASLYQKSNKNSIIEINRHLLLYIINSKLKV